ncbi:hypothetical protein SUGI_1507240 [Cryptomeria japonica]|uniref:Uncharacterized protein n=1 Tax=Cryptomeria japonica TaxID=3369 RepID=A0AAD3NTW8_CRYJA|nr:hypothetical protein SUGI_1507240 [Cryptomeria japonica]
MSCFFHTAFSDPGRRGRPTVVYVIIVLIVSIITVHGLVIVLADETIAVNLTTNEDLKGVYSRDSGIKNPYSGSFIDNCLTTLCSATPISLIEARGEISHQDLGQNEAGLLIQLSHTQYQHQQLRMMTQNEVKTSDV